MPVFAAIRVLGSLIARHPVPPDPCALLTRAEAAGLLGVAVTAVTPEGPAPDPDTGAEESTCTYGSSHRILVVSLLKFASAAEAAKAVSKEVLSSSMSGDDSVKVVEDSGLGERAYFASTAAAASYLILRGNTAVGIGLVGEDLTDAASLRPSLRRAAQSVLGRM